MTPGVCSACPRARWPASRHHAARRPPAQDRTQGSSPLRPRAVHRDRAPPLFPARTPAPPGDRGRRSPLPCPPGRSRTTAPQAGADSASLPGEAAGVPGCCPVSLWRTGPRKRCRGPSACGHTITGVLACAGCVEWPPIIWEAGVTCRTLLGVARPVGGRIVGKGGHAQRVSVDDLSLGAAVARAQDGDETAFAVLYRLVQPGLHGYLRGMVGEGAEDVAAAAWREIGCRGSAATGTDSAAGRRASPAARRAATSAVVARRPARQEAPGSRRPGTPSPPRPGPRRPPGRRRP